MRLTKGLHFAFEVESENHGTIHVHSAPIARATFETYFAELKAAFDSCFDAGDPLTFVMSGPRIAYAALKSAAMKLGTWEAPKDKNGVTMANAPTTVQDGLIQELVRLTEVAYASGGQGWQTLPMATAIAREILDEESHYEILGLLVFFSSASKVGPRDVVQDMMTMMESAGKWQFGSWNSTAYVASLPISTPDESTTTKPSSVIA